MVDTSPRPRVAILNTWSELGPCHVQVRQSVEAVKRGVWLAGGYPVELPVASFEPTAMLYRNLLSLETEELLRSHPIDGVVLLAGCDTAVPGLLMGGVSLDLPLVLCPTGAGTMTAIADVLGLTLTGASSIPAVDPDHVRMASACGSRIVSMIAQDLRPSRILTARSFHNAMVTYMALGGSTDAAIHLIAMAGRAGIRLTLDNLAEVARVTPVCVDMTENFFAAGGLSALLAKLGERLDLECLTVEGKTLGESLVGAQCFDHDVIRGIDNPVVPLSRGRTLAVLRGNLCPDGAVLRSAAAEPRLLQHEGAALVFDNHAELAARIDDLDLEVDENTVLVLRNAGPVGAPGMPEWGNLPLPKRLMDRGVRDMVRISDARGGGTPDGCCIVHVAPEAAIGGPLALVRTGDRIRLDVPSGRLDMLVDPVEIRRRSEEWRAPGSPLRRAYAALYQAHVGQAPQGCDFDFLI
jgi:dihydroxy-acid dehydratase